MEAATRPDLHDQLVPGFDPYPVGEVNAVSGSCADLDPVGKTGRGADLSYGGTQPGIV